MGNQLARIAVLAMAMLLPSSALATLDPSEEAFVRQQLNKKKTFSIGLSIGPRFTFDSASAARSAAVVTPGRIDATNADWVDMVFSGVVVASPFSSWYIRWLSFVAKLDLAQFDVAKVSGPARSIEGGIGLAARLNEDFFVGITFDRVYARSMRNDVKRINDSSDQFLTDSAGAKITSVSLGDDHYFTDNYLSGLSVVLIFVP